MKHNYREMQGSRDEIMQGHKIQRYKERTFYDGRICQDTSHDYQ